MGTISRVFGTVALAAAAVVALVGVASAEPKVTAYTLSDGSIAKTYDHCGDADLCATIEYANGEKLSFFSEGAGEFQPYVVHVVRTNSQGTVFEYSRAVERTNHAELTLDRGNALLEIDVLRDGTMRFTFQPVKKPAADS